MDHSATYSVEDDTLRIYLAYRLDEEEYSKVRAMGFRNAPKQGCQFAVWTPAREDFCIEMAGEIEPEGTTLAERAVAKAERLETLAQKRAGQANSFHSAARAISERFSYGQPILVGHHSERKARRDKERMESNMRKAVKCADAVDYWNYRASAVERHANRKGRVDVRERRIKKLLAELRSYQRDINNSYRAILVWEAAAEKKGTERFEKSIKTLCGLGDLSPYIKRNGEEYSHSMWSLLNSGEMSAEEVLEKSLDHHYSVVNSDYKFRCIRHLLNRLSYERSELGEVKRFEGNLTPTIIQAFLREHGAEQPKAKKEGSNFKAVSLVPLPLHIAEGCEIELNAEGWADLMQCSGYEVPAPKAKKPGIVNFKALSVRVKRFGNVLDYPQIRLSMADYMGLHENNRWAEFSECGTFKVRVCIDPENQRYDGKMFCVFIDDRKEHPAPDSKAVTLNIEGAEA